MLRTWDLRLLPPGGISSDLVGSAIEAPKSASGITQVIDTSGGGFWRLDMKRISIWSEPSHRSWLTMRRILRGGVGKVVVPLLNDLLAPPQIENIRWSDGSVHSDGGGHQSSTLVAEIAAPANVGAGTVTILVRSGRGIRETDTFSVCHPTKSWRAYEVGEIDSVVSGVDGTRYTFGIAPNLREALVGGEYCDFHRPRCLMRLPAGKTMPWAPERYWVFRPDVTFVEAMD